jgi:hypothetical protein
MRRSLVPFAGLLSAGLLAVAVFALVGAPRVHAAPAAQEQKPVIAQPEQDAVLRGSVQIIGTATHPQFQRYELYYAPWPVASDNSWIFIGPDAHFQQQPLGLLGTWDTRAVADGEYALRLRVVRADGNYNDSDPRHVIVANTKTPDTPTPTVTATPTETPVGAETPVESTAGQTGPETAITATAAIVVDLPADKNQTPQPGGTPTASPTPQGTPILASSGSDAVVGALGSVGDSISFGRISHAARNAALYTIGAFALVGLFFGFKAALAWLWQHIRP